MTFFETGKVTVTATHGTIFEMLMQAPTKFSFELRNDDDDGSGDDLDEFYVQVKPHEDSDWLTVMTQENLGAGQFPVAIDEQVHLIIIVDFAYSVRFTAGATGTGPQQVSMRGWHG